MVLSQFVKQIGKVVISSPTICTGVTSAEFADLRSLVTKMHKQKKGGGRGRKKSGGGGGVKKDSSPPSQKKGLEEGRGNGMNQWKLNDKQTSKRKKTNKQHQQQRRAFRCLLCYFSAVSPPGDCVRYIAATRKQQ